MQGPSGLHLVAGRCLPLCAAGRCRARGWRCGCVSETARAAGLPPRPFARLLLAWRRLPRHCRPACASAAAFRRAGRAAAPLRGAVLLPNGPGRGNVLAAAGAPRRRAAGRGRTASRPGQAVPLTPAGRPGHPAPPASPDQWGSTSCLAAFHRTPHLARGSELQPGALQPRPPQQAQEACCPAPGRRPGRQPGQPPGTLAAVLGGCSARQAQRHCWQVLCQQCQGCCPRQQLARAGRALRKAARKLQHAGRPLRSGGRDV